MNPDTEMFRRAGETCVDSFFLNHLWATWLPVAVCAALSLYVLWATDPRAAFSVRVCAWHPGGEVWMRGARWPRAGRLAVRAVEIATRWARLPAQLTHGACPACAAGLRRQVDRLIAEIQRGAR